jgi:MFS family permease
MTTLTTARRRIHPAWVVAAVAFVALLGAAGFRAAPGVLMVPLQDEFGWSRGTLSLAVGVNLVLFGLTAPFAAALMDRFGIRRVTASALVLIALGSGLSVLVRDSW